MLNNIVTLKSGLEVTQGHTNWCHSKAWVQFPIVTMAVTITICEIFSVKKWRDIENQVMGRSRSLKLVPFKSGCGFLFAFYSNYGRICSRLLDI